MRRNHTLAVGLLLFAIAWFLPVHEYGKTLPQILPGWEACLVALFPHWDGDPARRYAAVLSAASALTNLLPVILLLVWLRRREFLIRLTGWACGLERPVVSQRLVRAARRLLLLVALVWHPGPCLFAAHQETYADA